MSGGLLGHLTEAAHIVAGMDIPFSEALNLVRAAQEFAERDEPIESTTNVVYGVDFAAKR